MTTVRIVWIGCGRHANEMLLPQSLRHDVELVGVGDLNAETAARVGKRYGVPRTDRDRSLAAAPLPVSKWSAMARGPGGAPPTCRWRRWTRLPVFIEKPPVPRLRMPRPLPMPRSPQGARSALAS